MVVFHDEVLLEEAEGLLGRRGGEADERGVEVFEHLPPEVVDGAVALVGDDEVEFLDGESGVVFDRDGFLEQGFGGFDGQVVEVRRGFFLALEHGVDALDRADDDAGGFVERVAAEMLDDVFLGELVVVHGRDELLEFLERLPAEIAAIHEEQDALGSGVFHEAIDEIDGGVGLARAGGHLDERARTTLGEGAFKVVDGLDLRRPESAGGQRRKFAKALRQCRAFPMLHPGEQGFRAMKREHAAAARVGIEAVGKEGLRARALVGERKRRFPGRQAERDAGDIFGGLLLDAGEGVAFGLGLDGADGFAVNEQRVVRFAGLEGKFAMATPRETERLIWSFVWTVQPDAVSMASIFWRARCSGLSGIAVQFERAWPLTSLSPS